MSSAVGDSDRIEKLLPFWVNGTLAADEKREVEAALAADPHLLGQVEALRRIRAEMQASEPEYSPGELGLAQLSRVIDAEGGRPPRPMILAAYAASAAAVIGLAVMIAVYTVDRTAPTYTQASADAPGLTLTVDFQNDATEAMIAALLMQYGLTIVDGPSAIGLYQLKLADDADAQAVVAALRAATDVFQSVDDPQ